MSIIDTQVKYPADGNTSVIWIPGADGVDDVNAPTVEEIQAGVDLSCDIQSGGLDLGISSGTIEAASLCSANVSQSTGRTTVSPTLTFWRYRQPEDTAWDLARKGEVGWLVVRTGIASEAAYEDGQEVIVGLFEMGEPSPAFPGGDTNNTFALNFNLVNGADFDAHAVVGGAS